MKSRSIEVQTCLEGARQSKPAVIVKQIKGSLPAIPFQLAWDYFSAISGDALQCASREAKIFLTSKNFHEVCSAFCGGQPAEREKQRCFVILDTHLYQPARRLMWLETGSGAQGYLIEFIMKSEALHAMSPWNDMQYSMLITKCQLKIAQRRNRRRSEISWYFCDQRAIRTTKLI